MTEGTVSDTHPAADESDRSPDPEDFREEPPRPPGPLAHFPSFRHAVPAMLVFFIFYLATAMYQRHPEGDYLWLSGDALLNRHEFWRVLTSLLAHADLNHLLANAPIFLVFGWMLKAYFGPVAFPFLAFSAGFAANCIAVLAYQPDIRLVGASGMAYGMVALWLVFYIRHDTDHTVPMRVFRAVGFALIMLFPTTFDPRVSYLAHAIGFMAGLVLGLSALPFVPVRDPRDPPEK